eukprot:sb/3468547/
MGDEDGESSVYRYIIHPSAQSALRTECSKLADATKIITEFLLGISSLYDGLGNSMQKLVDENKKKMGELTKENLQFDCTTLTAWNSLLDNWKEEGKSHCVYAADIKAEGAVALQEQRGHFKDSIKRLYGFRDSIASAVARENEVRERNQKEYNTQWARYKTQSTAGTTRKGAIMPTYTAYNTYLLQLSNCNGVSQRAVEYQLPNLMEELEVVQNNLTFLISNILTYTFERQDHHYKSCGDIISESAEVVKSIQPTV